MKGYIPEEKKLAEETPGYRIKYYRMQSGLTQKELAEQCGINESTLRNYELNNRIPDKPILSRIASALNIHYYALADAETKNPDGAIHALFHLEKLYGLHPEMINGNLCIVAEKASPQNTEAAVFYHHVKNWLSEYEALKHGNPERNYLNWQAGFPQE